MLHLHQSHQSQSTINLGTFGGSQELELHQLQNDAVRNGRRFLSLSEAITGRFFFQEPVIDINDPNITLD